MSSRRILGIRPFVWLLVFALAVAAALVWADVLRNAPEPKPTVPVETYRL